MTPGRLWCVGDLMVDVLALLPGELAIGSDTPSPIVLGGGGSAANTAAWSVESGSAAAFVGRVGDDALGVAAVERLRRAGVEVHVVVDPGHPTGVCIVLVAPDGERTIVPSAGANALGAPVPATGPLDRVHVSGYALFHDGARGHAIAALDAARAAWRPVSVDAASAAPLRALGGERFLDLVGPALVFANLDEAAVLVGTGHDPAAAARRLAARCGEAVVKAGADGACWSDGDRVLFVPSLLVEVRDSTGAGDAFAAGFHSCRAAGHDEHAALRAGHGLAARAVTTTGARP